MKESKVKNSTNLFFSGVLVLTVSNLLLKVIGVLFKIPMNQIVGDQGMGYYSSAYTIYTFFYMLSTAGLPVAISLMVSENRAKRRIEQVKKVFKLSLAVFCIVGLLGTAAMFFGAGAFATLLKSDPTKLCIMLIAPTLFFICISSALRGYFQGYQSMVPVAISQLIEALCKLFLGIAFAYYAIDKYGTDKANIHYVAAYAVLGLTIGAGLGMLYLMFSKLLFKSEKYDAEYLQNEGEDDCTESSGTILKKIALIALPVTVSASVMSLTNLIDMTLIQRLLQTFKGMSEAEATAIYGNYTSLCVPMFNLPPYLIYPISYSIAPMLKTAIHSGDRKRAELIMESSLRVAVLIGIPCGLGMAALAEPILHVFGYRYWSVVSAAPLLTLLAPSTFFICVLSVSNAILQANGFERKPVISMLVGAAVKIISNIFLIMTVGMVGTPISTFLCYLTATSLNIYFVVKHVGLKLNIGSIFLRPLVAGVLCAVTAVGVFNVSASFTSNEVPYQYTEMSETTFLIEGPSKSSYLHEALFDSEDGTVRDTRGNMKAERDEEGDVTVTDYDGTAYKITYGENGEVYVDEELYKVAPAALSSVEADLYYSDESFLDFTLIERDGELSCIVCEDMNYELKDDKLTLIYPSKNNAELELKCNIEGNTATVSDGNSKLATVAGIGAAAVVYVIFIFIIKAITADDVKLLPKGQKIERALRKVRLLK